MGDYLTLLIGVAVIGAILLLLAGRNSMQQWGGAVTGAPGAPDRTRLMEVATPEEREFFVALRDQLISSGNVGTRSDSSDLWAFRFTLPAHLSQRGNLLPATDVTFIRNDEDLRVPWGVVIKPINTNTTPRVLKIPLDGSSTPSKWSFMFPRGGQYEGNMITLDTTNMTVSGGPKIQMPSGTSSFDISAENYAFLPLHKDNTQTTPAVVADPGSATSGQDSQSGTVVSVPQGHESAENITAKLLQRCKAMCQAAFE